MESAFNAAGRTPAGLLPVGDIGLPRPGDSADVLVLDDGLSVRTVLHDGVPLDAVQQAQGAE